MMKSLELMMRAMMSTMAENDGMQMIATDMNTRIEGVQNVVQKGNGNVETLDNTVKHINSRITDLEKPKSEMHDAKLKQDTIQEAVRAAATSTATTTTRIISTAPSAAASSSATKWRPRIVHIRGFAPFGAPGADKLSERSAQHARDECPASWARSSTTKRSDCSRWWATTPSATSA